MNLWISDGFTLFNQLDFHLFQKKLIYSECGPKNNWIQGKLLKEHFVCIIVHNFIYDKKGKFVSISDSYKLLFGKLSKLKLTSEHPFHFKFTNPNNLLYAVVLTLCKFRFDLNRNGNATDNFFNNFYPMICW